MLQSEAEQLSHLFFGALEKKDLDTALGLLADQCSLWHNTSRRTMVNDEARDFLAAAFSAMPALRYHDIRILATAEGWVQQHMVDSDLGQGHKVRDLGAALVVKASAGKIHSIAEYYDSAQVAGFTLPQS